jgi:2-polyprenyl-3-methyl-5-hydroxy-6-metoxy-1,4-benzoquinol methylase
MQETLAERSYRNAGNPDVVALIAPTALRVLDVGCGAGDNAALLRARNPVVEVYGITASLAEAEQARQHMQECLIADLESELPSEIAGRQYDAILCSHVP